MSHHPAPLFASTLVALTLVFLSALAPRARAAAPAVEGAETTISFGYGSWWADTSGENPDGAAPLQRYRYAGRELLFHGGLRHRLPAGLSISGDLNIAPTFVIGRETLALGEYVDPEHSAGALTLHGSVAARVGWHFSIGGIELGPALVTLPADERRLMPSGLAWFGLPEIVYGWASIFEGPVSGVTELSLLGGLGHKSDHLRLELGSNGSSGRVRLGLPVKPGVWLGLDGGAAWQDTDGDATDWRALMQVTVDHKKVGEGVY